MRKNYAGGIENSEEEVMDDLKRSLNRPEVEVGDVTVRMEENEMKRWFTGGKHEEYYVLQRARYSMGSSSREHSD